MKLKLQNSNRSELKLMENTIVILISVANYNAAGCISN